MSKIPKILPATTTFSFCPDGSQTLQDNADQTFYNSYGTLLTTMHKQCSDSFLDVNAPQSPSPSTHQAAYYRKLRGQKYSANEFRYFNHQRILICIFEGITTRIYGITFNLTCSTQNGLSSFDTTDLSLFPNLTCIWFPPITAQSSQFSNSMPSPTTHVASNQSSQLEHPSYFQQSITNG